MSRSREQRNLRKLETGLRRIASQPCLLCGGPPAAFGVWTPEPAVQDQLGRPDGKARLALYSLCAECLKIPDPRTRIEDKILAGVERIKHASDRN
jgi:hypothetical protein